MTEALAGDADDRGGRPLRIAYVTAALPYGASEAFFLPEIAALAEEGCEIDVVPVRGSGDIVHSEARALVGDATERAVSPRILRSAAAEIAVTHGGALRPLRSLLRSRSALVLAKNAAVVPKALWLAQHVRATGADHLHAHWAGTSATLAMLASEMTGVPWSFTAHRWDIPEDNLLRTKAWSACFVRVISGHGAAELRSLVGEPGWEPWVLHMGVRVPSRPRSSPPPEPPLRIVTAARFVEKKGHADLVEAVALLRDRGVRVHVDLAGTGPLERSIRELVRARDLESQIVFLGNVPHERLLRDLESPRWHASVLPSLVTPSGELEGIPVSLIESMAAGVPAIGTETGGIPELLGAGAGILVPSRDPDALADAIESLAGDRAARAELGERGRARVEEEFSVDRIAAALHARFRACARSG